jgi:hypothetical protein
MKHTFKAVAFAAATLIANASYAGPFILAGTDADDHGSANATTNFDGWLFMQKALENIAPSVTNVTNKVVYSLGSNVGSSAGDAAASAFSRSSLVAAGWTFQAINGDTNIATFLQGANGGIIMLDSGNNVGGGLDTAERAALTANASSINSFVGSGGGLFSQANGYGWLSALVPTLTVVDFSDTGLTLTAAGNAAFPSLTNADLSAGPWHNYFTGVGALPVLAEGFGGVDVILGASGGSITVPVSAVPEPETYALMIAGLGLVGAIARRRKAKQTA